MTQERAKSTWLGRVVGGRYEIVEKLSDGSHSEIFWGRNLLGDGPDAAIKVVAAGEEDPFAGDLLHREGTILEAIKGQRGCPKLLERHFTKEGDLALVLELLDGMSLEAILGRGHQRISLEEVITLFEPVVETLSALHQRGIIHRNIHPGNIFRSWDPPGLKLLSYGEATFVRSTFLRDSARVCGIPKYVAPEVWEGRNDLDERSDIYSMAVVLFRCLAGRCPFESDSAVELVRVVPRASRPSLARLTEGLPSALDDWTNIALSSERDGRFDNIEAMWSAFIRASRGAVDSALTDSDRLRAS
jgi:serine/threonine protein kinase